MALSFMMGGVLVFKAKLKQGTKHENHSSQNEGDLSRKNLLEIIADQIESGNATCYTDDLVSYETCLLIQGALGAWLNLRMQEYCSEILYLNEFSKSSMFSREDILRAIDSPCFGYLYAVNVANTTPILVSSSIRSFYNIVEANFTKPQSDAELCLEVRHGICGNHVATAIALFERAGFKARAVEFYYEYEGIRKNHIIPEVLIDGCWRLIESTYGGYWVSTKESNFFELMCTDSVLAGNSNQFIYNSALLPYGINSFRKSTNVLSYLNTNADIVRGGIGKITISINNETGTENFHHKPNYVGDNKYDDFSDGSNSNSKAKITNIR